MRSAVKHAARAVGVLGITVGITLTAGVGTASAGDRTATNFRCYCGYDQVARLRATVRFEDGGEHVYVKDQLSDGSKIYAKVYDSSTSPDKYHGTTWSDGSGHSSNYSFKEGHRVKILVYMDKDPEYGRWKYLGFVKTASGKYPRA
ncbi:hypothetical protein G5C51_15330 [Streptomyces sp. A7024]|uniref:Uncharacterized protein n=1 Tax=Streptomyces coryli TaxID=1128680 RepID=A0A6G4U0N2_9ACTN|nr:hypothetical protein [Streptomyces coryli]NGN65266.1 hypothetical protein [Streptomyces coryli]